MSAFDSEYESFHDTRTKIKAHLDSIDQAITSLMSISNNDEITSLASATSTSLVEAQLITNQYDRAVSSLKKTIDDMTDEAKKSEELKHFEEHMEQHDGGNGVPVSTTGLQELVRDKKMHYQLSLTENLDRVKLLTAVSSSPTPVIPPPVSTQSSIPSNGEATNHSVNDSTTIGQLSTSITQLLNHISSSTPRPNLALPPVKLETFDGSDLTRWPAFRYQLDQLVLNQASLSEVEKAFHVRNSLRGNAFNLVASIPVHEKFLDKIIHRLETQYGRDSLSQAKLIQSLRGIRSKTNSVSDQLSTVQSMISLAHSIHSDSGVDSLYVRLMLAECIHPRFITLISRSTSKTLLSSLGLIESQLLSEYEDTLTISAYTAREEQTSHYNNHSVNTLSSPPNNRAQRANNQSFNPPPHKGHPPSNQRHSNNKKPLCVYCGRHLFSSDCTQVSSIKDRKEVLRRKSLCNCCFSSSHSTSDCTRSCVNCNGKHHKSLCDRQSVPRSVVNTITIDHPIQVNNRLFTSPVMLANPTATKCSMANVLLDTGAQISLISRTLANSLQLSPVGQLLVSINGLTGPNDTSSSPSNHDIVEFQLVTNNGKESIKALVRDTDDIVGSINHPPLSSADLSVIESTLSFIPSHFSDSSICPDLLLGVSDTLKLLDDSKSTTLPCGYRLIQSVIGPLVAGSENIGSTTTTPDQSNPSSSALRVASVVTSTEDSLEKKIEHLFSVDPIARVYDTTEREYRKLADESVTRHFDDTIQLRDDGYYVQYAIKPSAVSLPDNHDLAVSRLASTVRILTKDHSLLSFYDSVIMHHIRENANDYDPQLVCQLVSNLYVDNVIINADSPSLGMYTQSKRMFESMSMNLRDYASNDQTFTLSMPESDRSTNPNQKLLGLLWNTTADSISIKIPVSDKRAKESKRSMCSTIASPYDPLGLLSPLLLPPRLTVQGLWNQSLKWDDPVDETTRNSFHKQISESNSTIPKMELESLTMAHALLLFTVESIRKEFANKPISVYSFSDSAVVLHWLKPEFNKPLGVLVTNRTVIDLTRHSSLKKAINVTATVYRFLVRCAMKTKNERIVEKLSHIPHDSDSDSTLSAIEKRFAMNRLIFLHQSQHVSMDDPLRRKSIIEDATGILRIGTRLSNSDMSSDFKSPIYIPTSVNSTLARLIVKDIHCSSSHASVDIILNSLKSRYYIPRARSIVVSSLLPSTFIFAFRRFCARRGTPSRVTSDKATTLKMASTLLSEPSSKDYIPPEEENSSREAAIKQLSRSLATVDSFWMRWHAEYLSSLRDSTSKSDPLQSTRSSSIPPQCGSIVLVADENGNIPRSQWKMAKILSLTNTSAKLRSHAGRIIERPINLLIPLEIHSSDPSSLTTTSVPSQTTHPMRQSNSAKSLVVPFNYTPILPFPFPHRFPSPEDSTVQTQCNFNSFTDHIQRRDDHSMYEQRIDEEASLLNDPLQSQLDEMTKYIVDELRALGTQLMGIDNEIQVNRDAIQSLSQSVVAIQRQLSVVVTKLSNPVVPPTPRVAVAPPTPRVAIAPRSYHYSNRNSSIPRVHPSSSIHRSRSPIRRRDSPTTKATFPHKAPIRCTFCDSIVHLSRNCTVVRSLTKRHEIMSENDCQKCFRALNDSHSSKCEPDVCRRGCTDESGRPKRHMDWFCPLNPSLEE
ncbi:hypothetical protein PRIPAC_73857 [Pristionchus pacificus]|uniref:DUF5641 domain-containing protein n=1 Tax=Pristionchus pacificus TaxID=54126 RepID=A0A2A6C7F1_PRIPA|nr:hypothetical protein PRIPAC_73857 [Pristionchus pacificus]|eukprot:PDM74089.1 hypothetical protein PRIPAC_41445 [Pristionchus pacificus]